ncbi:MAG: YdeI/OmpD-associated family protein [Ferruginibacter sp.]
MAIKDKKIDAYIAKSADFAKPILEHIRELVHKTCPDVEEKMKWSFPHFDYKGEMMCSMAAFKEHAVMGFWKASLMKDAALLEMARSEIAMGHLGRISSIKDLPSDKKVTGWIRQAMTLTDKGIKLAGKSKSGEKKELIIPDYFSKALNKNKAAVKNFEGFSYSNKKDYVEWITGNKTQEIRNKNIATAIEWIAEGKPRHWKYQK